MADLLRRRRPAVPRALTTAAATAVVAQLAPSVTALGQYTGARALPGALCRWQGPRFPGKVALTFDDGPHPTATPAILDRLDDLGLKATFFPLANLAERDPGMIAEITRRGHALGTHGYSHEHHLLRTPRWILRDLARADRAMAAIGAAPTWYRPAYGQATATTLLAARRRGWRTVLWSAWGREWATTDPAQVAERVAGRLWPGAIVLLHDNDAFGRSGMWRVGLAAIGDIAAALERRHLVSATLDELVPR